MALKSFREDPRRARHEKLVALKQIPVIAAKPELKVAVPAPTQNPTQISEKELKLKKEMA